jgi:signal transduction histidine kinase
MRAFLGYRSVVNHQHGIVAADEPICLDKQFCFHSARFGTQKALEPLRRVNAAGTHLLSLINEVLDLSKIEAGKLELNPERVDLARLIDEVSDRQDRSVPTRRAGTFVAVPCDPTDPETA